MSSSDTSGFGKFVPGFEFLQGLAKGSAAGIPQMPNIANWVAPTLNVEELDKRIEELRNVQFWLDQNSRALAATIQALEVQRMTLATLKGMNLNLADLASAFQFKMPESKPAARAAAAAPAPEPAKPEPKPRAARKPAAKAAPAAAGMVDPLQLWGSLTQQFQQIAAGAMKDVASRAASDQGKAAAGAAAASAGKPERGRSAGKAATASRSTRS